jgi:hypothetical protein
MKLLGGDKLRSTLTSIETNSSNATTVKAGFLAGATPYPDGTAVAMIAVIHDFGAPNRGIPPRPFFRAAAAAGAKTWPPLMAKLSANGYDARTTLEFIGARMQKDIKDSIRNGGWAPLKPATIARKGFTTPLIDTGQMVNSVNYEVD